MQTRTLGKRSRDAADSEEPQALLTRSKRRLVINEPNDENENPFVRPIGVESEPVVEDAPREKRARRAPAPRTVPAKHGAPGQRVAVFEDGNPGSGASHASPLTPRHRDASARQLPVTPRHRVLVAGSRLTLTPRTPKSPNTPSNSTSVYQPVRQLFSRCSVPGRLVGREQEQSELSTFITSALESTSGGCLYVSGPPGTGKSTLVDEATRQLAQTGNLRVSVVNCMSVRNTKDLTTKLCEDLGLDGVAGSDSLQSRFVRGTAKDEQKYIVVLDEVDRLVDLNLALLYKLFEWALQDTSRLILIGIANALDLTDRFLPRLKSRNLKPELLPFMPYTASQIAEVLTLKLKSLASSELTTLPFLHPAAIQFCAKKVAAQTGDLRKAFDICRRAIDLVETETREKEAEVALQNSPSKTPLMENINLSSPPRSPPKTTQPKVYTAETAPKATIAHVARVTAQVFGNGTTQRLGTLNLQQKAVLCALSALEKHRRDTQVERMMLSTPSKKNALAPTVKQLFESYTALCKRDALFHPLTSIEFRDVVSGLETLSLLSRVDGGGAGSFALPMTPSRTPGRKPKNGGFGTALAGDDRRVASAFGASELLASLTGPGGELLKTMLEEGALL